ncbi:MAG: bifunctional DNA-formamidopyrimidine glycosylase/DNA-(apurinic or apyrimidinic site) lyase [Patescibacteria group bacterium]|nr:bifunctional DNA-formamidopyrimidine glycosylase/DNA-(apurinic or apyrimidinic site) lyase [Patescibacteria group bacterium]
MPELPEVETIKRSLEKKIINKTINDIEILSPKNFIGNKKEVIGLKINSIQRYGKVLVFKLANPQTRQSSTNKYLNFHFKLSGQLLYADYINNAIYKNKIPFTKGNKMPANTTRVIIKFSDNSGLFFNDLRKFGWIKISQKPLVPKGIDVLSKKFTVNCLTEITKKSKKPIKLLLMDQEKLTGIGNIYANDSLFLAKIHPQRLSNSLTKKEIKNLYQSIIKEIKKGIKDKGSSGADEAFILPDGSKGTHQRNFLVYQQEKKPCPRCQTPIKRIKQNNRSSFFCPKCQNK